MRDTERGGHGAQAIRAGCTSFAVCLPPAEFLREEGQAAFELVLGSTWRIVAASLTAYIVSSPIDVQIFAWWRERVGRHCWAQVLTSNVLSTLIDSVLFISIAFAGVMPILPLIVGQYAVKMAVAVISIPLIDDAKVRRAASMA